METQDEKNKVVKNDAIDIDNETEVTRTKENIEKSSSSKVATAKFSKAHGRVNNALGESHEPGTVPGTGL